MQTTDEVTGPINLGNPIEFSIAELAEKVIEMTGSRSVIKKMPLPQDDPKQRRPDIDMARETLNWEPKLSLDEGLRHTIEYFDSVLINHRK